MTDWADEIARQLTDALMYNGGKNWDHITLALRKAKADGMREAIKIMKDEPNNCAHWAGVDGALEKIRIRANAIEKGTE